MLHFACCVAFLDPAANFGEFSNNQSGSTIIMVLKCNTESKKKVPTPSERALNKKCQIILAFCLIYFSV